MPLQVSQKAILFLIRIQLLSPRSGLGGLCILRHSGYHFPHQTQRNCDEAMIITRTLRINLLSYYLTYNKYLIYDAHMPLLQSICVLCDGL